MPGPAARLGRFRVGTSGFGYREWVGKFFPRGLRPDELLPYYAERFDAVEINSSFYRMPTRAVVRGWLDAAPRQFRFCFKAPAAITHVRRLREPEALLRRLLYALEPVGPRLGAVIFQLPPSFRRDLPRLEAFLGQLPRELRCGFEFRHPSWFDDEVVSALRRRRVALVHNDADVERCPLAATAPFGVVKLRRVDYTRAELRSWARRLRAAPWRRCYVFFKHEERATGPIHAAALAALLAERR
jgi:uncharacterized protein YecE (DUF72 family)